MISTQREIARTHDGSYASDYRANAPLNDETRLVTSEEPNPDSEFDANVHMTAVADSTDAYSVNRDASLNWSRSEPTGSPMSQGPEELQRWANG